MDGPVTDRVLAAFLYSSTLSDFVRICRDGGTKLGLNENNSSLKMTRNIFVMYVTTAEQLNYSRWVPVSQIVNVWIDMSNNSVTLTVCAVPK